MIYELSFFARKISKVVAYSIMQYAEYANVFREKGLYFFLLGAII